MKRPLYLYRLINPRAEADASADRVGEFYVRLAVVVAHDEHEARSVWPLPEVLVRRSQFAAFRRAVWARPEALDVDLLGTVDPRCDLASGDVISSEEMDATTVTQPIRGPVSWLITDRTGRALSLVLSPEAAAEAVPEDGRVFAVPAKIGDWRSVAQPVELSTLGGSEHA